MHEHGIVKVLSRSFAAFVVMTGTVNASCLQYDDTVSLTGTITMHKTNLGGEMPSIEGRPYAVLKLDKPICVSGPDEETENDVTVLALGYERTWRHRILSLGGKRTWPHKLRATVTGKLWHGFNLYHRTPVLMEAIQIKKRK
jgi:Domain of unknown function (DUF4431)